VPTERLASSQARERGRHLFAEHCALCHGEAADGHGVRRNLSSPATDLTDPHWRRRVTARDVFHAIREGKAGTAMPAWKTLSAEQTWDLTAYVLQVSEAAGRSGGGGGDA